MKKPIKKELLKWWYKALRFVGLITLHRHRQLLLPPPFAVIEFEKCRTLISVKAFLAIGFSSKQDDWHSVFLVLDRIMRMTIERGSIDVPFISTPKMLVPLQLGDLYSPQVTMEYVRFSVVQLACDPYPHSSWRWSDSYPRNVLTIGDERFLGDPHQLLYVITEKQIRASLLR